MVWQVQNGTPGKEVAELFIKQSLAFQLQRRNALRLYKLKTQNLKSQFILKEEGGSLNQRKMCSVWQMYLSDPPKKMILISQAIEFYFLCWFNRKIYRCIL
jgi:hypothetical protein